MDCLFSLPTALAFNLLAQATATPPAGISSAQWVAIGLLVAVIALPIFLGSVLAKAIRMPNYSTRIAWILFALLASVTVLTFGKLGLGVDLRGGTILVYEIDPTRGIPTESDLPDDGSGTMKTSVASSELIPSLVKRINPAGTQEIMIRPYGENQIEIIIPAVDQREVDRIKNTISQAGILRFAIVANTRDHGRLIESARAQSEQSSQRQRLGKTIFDVDGKTPIGFWALVDREDNADASGIRPLRVDVSRSIVRNPVDGRLLEIPVQAFGTDGIAAWMKSQSIENIQVLMAVDSQLDVTGEDLAFAATGFDGDGSPSVRFKLTDTGSGRFLALTTNNAPDGQHLRYLGIVLDDALLSAPSIRSPIQGDGQITGNFSTAEVENLVRILKAGQLPAALTKQPIAENQIDATLGADTIRSGLMATIGSMIAVLVFMLLYYRFLGVIACIALTLNLVMTVAVMILINQPLTLPGIAGLVLTIGMAVDANVLIFERLREEIAKGAAPRMSIRNGFSRATTTIIDSNLTTLITAIVLYAIGTDQIRGFAVTLILGLVFSMFTAIYVSRTLFDIAERKGFLSLSMSDSISKLRDAVTGPKGIDFMGLGPMAMVFSLILMAIGTGAVAMRGMSIFDIDFSGGSSVTFRLEKPATTDDVRTLVGKILDKENGSTIDFTVNNVSVDYAEKGTVYKVDSSLDNIDELKSRISKGFADDASMKMVTYDVAIEPAGDLKPAESTSDQDEKKTSQHRSDESGVQLVVFRPQDGEAAEPVAPASDSASEPKPTESSSVETSADATPPTATPPTVGVKTDDGVNTDDAASTNVKAESSAKPAVISSVVSRAKLSLGIQGSAESKADINAKTLIASILKSATAANVSIDSLGIEIEPLGDGVENWSPESDLRYSQWLVGLPLEFGPADEVMVQLKKTLGSDPVWISSSSVGSRVAGDMVSRAVGALVLSLFAIVAYVWFRFSLVVYGIAAVAALIHDVLITIGAIAISYWLADALGFLLVDQFKISLTVVAALLTIIGYSLNDTIVIFDRIRETKGKSLRLTREIINNSINATLSRTLLTALTTLMVVVVLYFFGGDGIHAFAFSLVIGVIAGTYSTVFIASPILLWLVQRYQTESQRV